MHRVVIQPHIPAHRRSLPAGFGTNYLVSAASNLPTSVSHDWRTGCLCRSGGSGPAVAFQPPLFLRCRFGFDWTLPPLFHVKSSMPYFMRTRALNRTVKPGYLWDKVILHFISFAKNWLAFFKISFSIRSWRIPILRINARNFQVLSYAMLWLR